MAICSMEILTRRINWENSQDYMNRTEVIPIIVLVGPSGEWSRAISPMDDTHGNSLPVKYSFRMVKHLPINSPAYDASKEDNDPLTDDAASVQNTIIIGLSSYTGGGEWWDRLAAADLVGSVKGGRPEVISRDRWTCWDQSQQYYNICK
ncbi:hypothetical protein JB92DRAFT_2837148 [Gautieria morchelliformis]|nr:hypothetical protein JB92DRAFT_2837148 [Gautieria morchelliformis]